MAFLWQLIKMYILYQKQIIDLFYLFQNEYISLIALFSHLVWDFHIYLILNKDISVYPRRKDCCMCSDVSDTSTLMYQGNGKI